MDKETEVYYENYFDIFSRPGWKQLMEDLKEAEKTTKESIEEAGKDVDVFRAQGELKQIKRLINFSTLITAAYEQLMEEPLDEGE